MYKTIASIWYLPIIICMSFACKKSTPTPTQPSTIDTVAQYGNPYPNVPAREDAVIYQINIRAFSNAGNFDGVISRLADIKSLGVNVIYLMPIYPIGSLKGVNSPYCVKDYQAINSEFGNLSSLRTLVDSAHKLQMAVMIDWVANHTAWDNAWITTHKNWYLQDAAGNIVSPPGTGWNDVAQLNFSNAEMRLNMIKCMKYWVYTANIDGFRCDYADGPPDDFWKQAIDTLRNITSHKLLVLAEGTRAANYNAGFDYNFGFNFYGAMKKIFQNGSAVSGLDYINITEYLAGSNNQQIVRYITNHDVNGSDGTPAELYGGNNGAMAAFVIAATLKGIPMIYNGQEIDFPIRITFPFTGVKINWQNNSTTNTYTQLLKIRNNYSTLRTGNITNFSTNDVCAFTKESNGETILVMVNVRNTTQNFSLPTVLKNISVTNLFDNISQTITNTVSLAPYQFLIYKKN